MFRIKGEYWDEWGVEFIEESLISFDEIKRLAEEWNVSLDLLMGQVEEETEEEAEEETTPEYRVITEVEDPENPNRYWWCDWDAADGKHHLYSGYLEDGEKIRGTQVEVIEFDNNNHFNCADDCEAWDRWEQACMMEALGFVPDYSIN